jgi:hypothetical protein
VPGVKILMNVHVNLLATCLYFNTQLFKVQYEKFNIKKLFVLPIKRVPLLSMAQAEIILLYSIMYNVDGVRLLRGTN